MNDYLTVSMDYIAGLGFSQAIPTRDWLAKFVVGRFTHPTEWDPLDGTPYQIAVRNCPDVADVNAPGVTQAMLSNCRLATSWAELHQWTFARRTTGTPIRLPAATCAMCYEANARAALTGAIRGGVANARTAYDFVDQQIRVSTAVLPVDPFLRDPTWLITP